MNDSFHNYYALRKSRLNTLKNNYKGLNHSNSQSFINTNGNNDYKRERNYLLPYNLKKNNNKLILPRVGDSFRIENGKNKYRKNQIFNANSSLNSSFNNNNKELFHSSRPNYYNQRREGPKNILDAPRKISGLLDYKINAALGNKKMREEMEKRRIMSKMRRRIDDELKRERSIDDLRFIKEFDEIEEKRQNIRLMREKMLNELKNQEIDDLENSFYIPPLPPPPPIPQFIPNPYPTTLFPPQIIMPPMNNNNHSSDSTGDLIKFLIVKKLLDKDEMKPFYPYPMDYFQGFPYPYMYYPPYIKIKKPKKPLPYPKPIIIQSPPLQNQKSNKKNKKTESNSSEKGTPFIDPLENYLQMLNRFKKPNGNQSNKGEGSKKENSVEENPEDNEEINEDENGDGEEGENGGEDMGGEGEEGDEGENGGEDNGGEGEGEGDGENGGEDMGGEGEGDGENPEVLIL